MAWGVVYYEAEDGSSPPFDFLEACPSKVRAHLLSVLEAVRASPPPSFSGGGKWEAMHGSMNGYYEIRATGPGRAQYRLFCILDKADKAGLEKRGFTTPQIAVVNGMKKRTGEVFSDREYKRHVRDLGDRYRSTFPRPIVTDVQSG